MDRVKKLILIEPRVLEELQQHREYKELQKPTDKKTKAGLSVEMQNVLSEDEISDDIKAKVYQQMFNKFMRTTDKLPESTESSINSTAPRQQPVRTPRARRARPRLNWAQY
jgi:hypothetical protein